MLFSHFARQSVRSIQLALTIAIANNLPMDEAFYTVQALDNRSNPDSTQTTSLDGGYKDSFSQSFGRLHAGCEDFLQSADILDNIKNDVRCTPQMNSERFLGYMVDDGVFQPPDDQSWNDNERSLGNYHQWNAQSAIKRDSASAKYHRDIVQQVPISFCGRNPWKREPDTDIVSLSPSRDTNDFMPSFIESCADREPFPDITEKRICQDNGIQTLHSSNVVKHCLDLGVYRRELNPENFLIPELSILHENFVKLADLGLANRNLNSPEDPVISHKLKTLIQERPGFLLEHHDSSFVDDNPWSSAWTGEMNLMPEPVATSSADPHSTCQTGRLNANHSRLPHCTKCGLTFSRAADLGRHMGIHLPERRKYHCSVRGCEYRGSYRKDKLASHVRNRHNREREFGG